MKDYNDLGQDELELAYLCKEAFQKEYHLKRAFDYFSLSDSCEGWYNLALCYQYGEGCLVDEKKAVTLFERASMVQYLPAMFQLSRCYLQGRGCDLNQVKAYQLMSEVAPD